MDSMLYVPVTNKSEYISIAYIVILHIITIVILMHCFEAQTD